MVKNIKKLPERVRLLQQMIYLFVYNSNMNQNIFLTFSKIFYHMSVLILQEKDP